MGQPGVFAERAPILKLWDGVDGSGKHVLVWQSDHIFLASAIFEVVVADTDGYTRGYVVITTE